MNYFCWSFRTHCIDFLHHVVFMWLFNHLSSLSGLYLRAALYWDPVASTERPLIGLVLKSSDLSHDSLAQSVCSTCWFDCHFQFSHDPLVLEWGISGRKWDWKLILLVWQLHSSESNAKCSSYLYSNLMLKQGIYCIYMLDAQAKGQQWWIYLPKFYYFQTNYSADVSERTIKQLF